jgi:hypothetical protein
MVVPKLMDKAKKASLHQNNMDRVFLEYLKMQTGYALLINGPRGIGKTHYVKYTLVPLARTVPVGGKGNRVYRPVFISLYGLVTIRDLSVRLTYELIPMLGTRSGMSNTGIAKLFIQSFLQNQGPLSLETLVAEMDKLPDSLLDTRNFVFIFDDLDRTTIRLEELIGFVNSLVEHENNKVVLITDQDHIDERDMFRQVREKSIGITLEYQLDFKHVFQSVIRERYKKGKPDFYRHLNGLELFIVSLFEEEGDQNLRTLFYFLQHFDRIIAELNGPLSLNDKELSQDSLEKLLEVFRFALAVSIEFRKGHISFRDRHGLDDEDKIHAWLTGEMIESSFNRDLQSEKASPKEGTEEQSFEKSFVRRYFNSLTYRFYPSIYDFITGGNTFDVNWLLGELKVNFDDRRHYFTRQDEIYNDLIYPQVYDLPNDRLISLTQELYELAMEGKLSLDKYLSVFHFTERFDRILRYNLEETCEHLIGALKAHEKQFEYLPMLDMHFDIEPGRPTYALFRKLFDAMLEVNKQIAKSKELKTTGTLFLLFKKDKGAFYQQVYELYPPRSVFAVWKFSPFYNHFKKMTNSELRYFIGFLKKRYTGHPDFKKADSPFFLRLYSRLQADQGIEHVFTIRDYVLEQLIDTLSGFLPERP